MISESLRRFLESAGAGYRVVEHDPGATAQETAHMAHVSGRRFAKVVLLREHEGEMQRYTLAVLPATERVDLGRLAGLLGHRVELASEPEYAGLFPEFDVGAAPPFGELTGVAVMADACLEREEPILFNGGTHTDLVEMSWPEFQRLARPRVIEHGAISAAV